MIVHPDGAPSPCNRRGDAERNNLNSKEGVREKSPDSLFAI
jgi:hypothetical protein